jgi:ribosomal protein S18 acetylase RimI-like enzyme
MELVDLRQLTPAALEGLLEEEVRGWREQLCWNFRPSADLVLRYVGMHALDGLALMHGSEAIGYSYFVAEERKGLVGDLYVRASSRTEDNERRLLQSTVELIFQAPAVKRVEAQLMMMGGLSEPPAGARAHLRRFLIAALAGAGRLPEKDTPRVLYEPWTMRWMDAASHLISEVYSGHVDSQINDQYRSAGGARRFLQNIVQYPGCGQFHAPASWLALEAATGRLSGLSLASLVADQVGHVTQICTAPWLQGRGAGYELLRRTMKTLLVEGCQEVTLTVTDENRHAIGLYERVGFRTLTSFDAYVWGE